MTQRSEADVGVIVPVGMLGAGVKLEDLLAGVARGAKAIACDSGSTDSGPSYLARGVSKMNREAIKGDLLLLMRVAHEAAIPLLIGSCGTAGTDFGVDWTRDIAIEAAGELGVSPRIACLYSEQSADELKRRNAQGRIHPLPPLGALDDATLEACSHIVALMGPEPYIAALQAGADIVLGGRTTDTAVLAAVPLMLGAGQGAAWHAAKISECGGQCTTNPRMGGVLMSVGSDDFVIEPLNPQNSCTPQSLSAHMLYETSDPILLTEPGGTLDVGATRYQALDTRSTRVIGSRWTTRPYTMKLEGAAGGPYQTIMLVGIEQPDVLKQLDILQERMLAALRGRVDEVIGAAAGDYDISLRIYGWNGVSGLPAPPGTPAPREVGMLFVATAATQELATQIAKCCNPYFFHFPVNPGAELPSYAFPFTPAEIERGQVYEFKLNHVVETHDGLELVRMAWTDLASAPKAKEDAQW